MISMNLLQVFLKSKPNVLYLDHLLTIDINGNTKYEGDFINGKYDYTYLDEQDKYYLENRNKNLEHVITHDDLLYKVFIKNGFTWGGDWETSKDYQHFEVDYE